MVGRWGSRLEGPFLLIKGDSNCSTFHSDHFEEIRSKNATFVAGNDVQFQHSANQPDLIIKIDEKCYIEVKLFHNPYFNKQLGKHENDMQPA